MIGIGFSTLMGARHDVAPEEGDGGGPAPAVTRYFLRANFAAADGALADGTVLSTQAQGIQDGVLKVVDTDDSGSLAISSNTLEMVNATLNGTFLMGGILPRSKMLGMQVRYADTPASSQVWAGYAGPWDASPEFGHTDGPWLLGGNIGEFSGFGGTPNFGMSFADHAAVEILQIAGGYDKNADAWDGDPDTVTDHLYGRTTYVLNGDGQWQLAFRNMTKLVNGAFALTCWNNTVKLSHVLVPDIDRSGLFAEGFMAGADIGVGDNHDAAGADMAFAFKVTVPSDGALDFMFRWGDDDNTLIARVDDAGALKLIDKTAGSETVLGTSGKTVASGNHIFIRAIGDDIRLYVNNRASDQDTDGLGATTSAHADNAKFKFAGVGTGGAFGWLVEIPTIVAAAGDTLPVSAVDADYTGGRNPASGAATNLLVCDGDSMWDGDDLDRVSVNKVLQSMLGPSWTVANQATGGHTLSDVSSGLAAVDALHNAGNEDNIYILWAGTNDFYLHGTDAATVAANAQAILAGRQAVGFEAMFIGMANRTQTGSALDQTAMDAHQAAYNSAMQSWCAANDATYIDLGARFTAAAASADDQAFRHTPAPALFIEPDAASGVHPSYWGGALVAQAIFDVLMAIR